MPFKRKVVKKVEAPGDAPLYIKPDEQAVVEDIPKAVTIKNLESELTEQERAMKHFGLTKEAVFVVKDYLDRIVIITTDGKKLTWPKSRI